MTNRVTFRKKNKDQQWTMNNIEVLMDGKIVENLASVLIDLKPHCNEIFKIRKMKFIEGKTLIKGGEYVIEEYNL